MALAPGPDNLFVLSQSAMYGARSGLLVVVGLCCGLVFQTLGAALGLGALITAVPVLFWVIKIIGAMYLLYLACLCIKYLRAEAKSLSAIKLTGRQLVIRGLIMNITNPKVQIFFLAFFMQFVAPSTQGWALVLQMIVQGLIFMFMTFIVFSAIALGAGTLAEKIKNPKFMMILNALSAVLFISLAIFTLCF